MYPSKGSNPYGQQPYGAPQRYGQMSGSGYAGHTIGGTDASSQYELASRQSSMLGVGGGIQEADLSGYRSHHAQGTQYIAQYGVYDPSAISNVQQARSAYPSAQTEPAMYTSGALGSTLGMSTDNYVSSLNRGFSQKVDQLSSAKDPDYASMNRRNYSEHPSAFLGREVQSDTGRRYPDTSIGHHHQSEIQDHAGQASIFRQQQILKSQSLQSASDLRQTDYLAARTVPTHHGARDISSYGGRTDADLHGLSILGTAPHAAQHTTSVFGGPPRRNLDDLAYVQGSSSSVYGVALPPGRDYGAGKGVRGPSLESDYQGSIISRAYPSHGDSMVDERKDDRSAYRRELERDEERRRELIRARNRERELEEREREREKDRERLRLRELREKEKERDRNRARERTPPRVTRDRRVSSSLKDDKRTITPRRVSPRREPLHRHRSPVKEKKREYICKVYPFCLVDEKRDYLSLSKRYPRLAISPDFTKVVVNWPRKALNLSLHTPVSFEHDFLKVDEKKDLLVETSNLKGRNTVWNPKVILMSGISSDVMDELCSEASVDDKVVHFNNILKFAILRKGHSFMAIGGASDLILDCGDTITDDSSLIQAAVRCVKDSTQLDLSNCVHWNRFLEIHYDRFGKDGLFSHKEITVLYVPNLSDCLPSVDRWRNQWLSHKKNVAERERHLTSKQQKKSGEKKEVAQGEKGVSKSVKDDSTKSLKSSNIIVEDEKSEIKADDPTDSVGRGSKKDAVDGEEKEPLSGDKQAESKVEAVTGESNSSKKVESGEPSAIEALPVQKPIKKKIVKKVVKRKAAGKKTNSSSLEEAIAIEEECNPKQDEVSADPSKAKTISINKVATVKSTEKEDQVANSSDFQIEKKPEEGTNVPDGEEKVEEQQDGNQEVKKEDIKTTPRKKIVKRVIKRRVAKSVDKDVTNNKEAEASSLLEIKGQDEKQAEIITNEGKIIEGLKTPAIEEKNLDKKSLTENKESNHVDDNSKLEKDGSRSGNESEDGKSSNKDKDNHDGRKKGEKEKNKKESAHELPKRSHKESKEKTDIDEPPKYPGLILQTVRGNESKIRSTSLSLNGLLGYNDKDVEESTFELSLFAESFNEMLQYQMGCRLLSFLLKLRQKHIMKRNERKRQRDENPEKGSAKEALEKRPKTDNDNQADKDSTKPEKEDASNQQDNEVMGIDGSLVSEDGSKSENMGLDEDMVEEEEDPEEIIEEEEERVADAASVGVHEDVKMDEMTNLEAKPEMIRAVDNTSEMVIGENNSGDAKREYSDEKNSDKHSNMDDENNSDKAAKIDVKSENEDKQATNRKKCSEKDTSIDKELLQAFRYFDQNRANYIKVEDLRCILNNLGEFLSHRDVKELTQIALSESNSARDNRIIYKKLVMISDL